MNKRKNLLAVTLMVSSIALLLILQLFWLRSSYERAYFGLRRESNYVFRNTLNALRDSLYKDNIRVVGYGSDSLRKLHPNDIKSVNIVRNKGYDSVTVTQSSTIQVFVTPGEPTNRDSIINAIRPMTGQLKKNIQEGKHSFMLRLSPDTISLDTLTQYLTGAFKKAELPLAFTVSYRAMLPERFHAFNGPPEAKEVTDPPLQIYSDTLQLESVRFNPASRYSAQVFPVHSFILKQIAPQILFSCLLTLITTVAFLILYRSVRAQQRLMELKNDFISNVTHELKTPVATVSVALEALKNFHALNDPKLTKEYLDIAQNELNRLTLMTDKILKASVFENKGITIQHETLDIRTVTSEILDSLRLVFEKRQANVSLQSTGENFSMQGETAHISNVIYNLIDNALKYSPGQPVIAITLTENPGHIVLSVRDEGLGIPTEYKKKVFEKFFRVPTGDVHNIKGYGLGLSYVASVVKAHHARITVESESGKGSTFIIEWPKVHA
jgi:two-component system, OmpR family, phosphate regulon sensor histidine kinase PhoR